MHNLSKSHSRGFTLIELLVVIAIIGVLSSVVIASVNSARRKAKDARRVADMTAVKKALELYYDDNGHYPVSSWASQCQYWSGGSPAASVIPGLVPNYLKQLPADPDMDVTANTCCYVYGSSNGQEYKFQNYYCQAKANYASRPDLIDPRYDGGADACLVDGSTFTAWQVSSSSAAACL